MATSTLQGEQTAFEPTVTVTDIGPCRKKLDIEAPAEAVTAALGETFDGLAAHAQVRGFRPGKAPRALIERVYGRAARDEAKQRLVSAAYSKAIETHKLRVLGEPEGGDELKDAEIKSGKPLSFSVEVEVAPEFELPSAEGIKVLKPIMEATDEMVAEQISRVSINEGDLEERDNAERGDYCTGRGRIFVKGSDEAVLDISGAVIQITPEDKGEQGQILGVLVDDFVKQVGAPKKGDTLEITAKGPENHETEAVRGKDLRITFEIDNVYRIIPASVEQLCERFGFENEEGLREQMKLRLNQQMVIRQQAAMRQQIAKHLLDSVEMDLPEKLSARQAERRLQRQRFELMHRGVDAMQVEEQIAMHRAQSDEIARRELKLFFILDRIATDNNIQVTEPEVNQRIAQMAYERGQRPDQLRQELIQGRQVGFIVQQIREHKTLDQLVTKAQVEETTLEKFNDEMKKRGEEAA